MSGEKIADLGWSQRYLWLRHEQLPSWARHELHNVWSHGVPEGVSLPAIRSALNYLARRHEALRTTYHRDADADPWQRVHPPGPLPLVVASTERDGTPAPAEVIDGLSTREFALDREWPIRACVLTTEGKPRRIVLVLHHMAFDAWTADRLERELIALGAGAAARRPAALEPVRHQPLDLARHEASAEAAAVRERALTFWRNEIAALPTDAFAHRRGPARETPAHAGTLTAPSIVDATRRIAERHRVWPSLVHTAAYTAAMAAYTGGDQVAHLSFTGNRTAGAFVDVMTSMFSPVLIRLDCGGNPTFGELLRRAAECAERAGEHSRLPHDDLVELLSREGSARGTPLRTGSELNFLSRHNHTSRARRDTYTPSATPAAWAAYGADTYFRIDEYADAVAVTLQAGSTVMDAAAVERFLRGYRDVLLAAASPAADPRLVELARLIGFAPPETAGRLPGRPAEPSAPDGAEEALVTAVARANRRDRVDASAGYVTAGGRVLRIPRVLALLRERGWAGLPVHRLAGGEPLRALAAGLVRTTARTNAATDAATEIDHAGELIALTPGGAENSAG